MPTAKARLSLLTLPQSCDGANLKVRVLALPKGNPLVPLLPNAPVFAKARLVLDAAVIPSLNRLPDPADVTVRMPLALAAPLNAVNLFQELNTLFRINPNPPTPTSLPQATAVKKYLMSSYRQAFGFDRPRTRFAVVDDSYECAVKDPAIAQQPPSPPPSDEVSWGQVLGFVLRQAMLAREVGLLYEATLALPAPNPLENGGWLYIDLNSGSDYAVQIAAQPDLLSLYAARIPALGSARTLFASALFPVQSGPTPGSYDPVFVEAELYDDGFAKIVHGAQPLSSDLIDQPGASPLVKDKGIRLGWDDEQIAIWMNRQILPDINDPTRPETDAPMGVSSYRVDVREAGSAPWHSLAHVRGTLQLNSIPLGQFDGELTVETLPSQPRGQKTGDFWLPTYFATWSGGSLVLNDPDALQLSGLDGILNKVYQAVGAGDVPLRYGRDYEFRVRLADLSGGGPSVTDDPINPAPAPIARIPFRRFVPPRAVRVLPEQNLPPNEPRTRFRVQRPLLGYPDLVYTGFSNAASALIADMPAAKAEERETGLPDPDVSDLQIEVEVQSADGSEPFLLLYTAARPFPSNPGDTLDLQIIYQDAKDIAALQPVDPHAPRPGTGPLVVPTARDIRLTFTPVCRADPNLQYFGSQAAQVGTLSVRFVVRAPSADERQLFVPRNPAEQLEAIFLQPDPPPSGNFDLQLALAGLQNQATLDLAGRLARQLGLEVSGLHFQARPRRRTVFGCSSSLRHTLAPDRSSITFSSKSDLIRHWIVAIRLQINRDWTWDALASPGVEIARDQSVTAGRIDIPRTFDLDALAEADRSQTDLVFFDAIDPKPELGNFPAELHVTYSIRALFRDVPATQDPPLSLSIRLPIAAAPAQTPRLASAGLALSDYLASVDYSSTLPRQRLLWFEFDAPPADPRDKYFARVLACAPDPMLLLDEEAIPDPQEPPLPVDPELIRVITPNQSADLAGLDAMQELTPAPGSPRHYLVPMPPTLSSDSPEIFGFFVYELRVGHDRSRWSTAQARFGPPLRITGVQHPAPPLSCQVRRNDEFLMVSAAFATPVFEGRNLRPRFPRTAIWVMLYAQVTQVDGRSRRNVLLARAPAELQVSGAGGSPYADDRLTFGISRFSQGEIDAALRAVALPIESPLSVLAVELLPEPEVNVIPDPLGANLGQVRILRTSPLTPAPEICH